MPEARVCPNCQKPIASNGPLGLCPECLIKSGFLTGTDPGTAATPTPGFTPPSLEEIAELFPQLEILQLIGRGGMGAVYKARQRQLDRVVALKILPREAGRDPSFAERFEREAKALARLNHPNIVSVYDSGQQDGLYYFLMEFVDGVNLRQLEQSHRPSPEEALAIVPSICDALQYAHQQGIVHRDIKPENILLDNQGRVKIADFGIAKILSAELKDQTLTGAGKVGTPHYMAPEQVEQSARVDHRADIFSLGVVFYEMLTGELPLGRFAPPSRKVHVDVRLDEIVLRALEKEPERRYQQAEEVKTEVETVVSTPAREYDELSALKKFKRLSVALWLSALVFIPLLCLLSFIAWSKWQASHTPASPPAVAQAAQSPGQGIPAAEMDASPEEIRNTTVEAWFTRFEKPAPDQAPFRALRALVEKAKESDAARRQIIQLASKIIDNPAGNQMARWQSCYVLSGTEDPQVIPILARALKDQNETVRGCAACALGAFDHADATAALEAAAKSEQSPAIQEWIRKALNGEFRKPPM